MADKTHRSAVTGDYSDLRARAEACPPEDDANSEWYSEDRLKFAIGTKDRPFVAACSPTVVLGLLHELDRLGGVVHTQEIAIDGYREAAARCAARCAAPAWRDALEWAAQHIFVNNGQTANARRWLQAAAGSASGIAEVRDVLPIVRKVGDLAARHIGRRVRVGKTPPATLMGLSWREVGVRVHLFTPDADAAWQNLPLNTPCEVLP